MGRWRATTAEQEKPRAIPQEPDPCCSPAAVSFVARRLCSRPGSLRPPPECERPRGLHGENCSSPQRRCGPEPLRVFRGSSCIGATPSSGSSTQFPFGNQGSPLVPEAQGVAYPPLLRKEVCLFDFAASSRAACFGFILSKVEANFSPDLKTLRRREVSETSSRSCCCSSIPYSCSLAWTV